MCIHQSGCSAKPPGRHSARTTFAKRDGRTYALDSQRLNLSLLAFTCAGQPRNVRRHGDRTRLPFGGRTPFMLPHEAVEHRSSSVIAISLGDRPAPPWRHQNVPALDRFRRQIAELQRRALPTNGLESGGLRGVLDVSFPIRTTRPSSPGGTSCGSCGSAAPSSVKAKSTAGATARQHPLPASYPFASHDSLVRETRMASQRLIHNG